MGIYLHNEVKTLKLTSLFSLFTLSASWVFQMPVLDVSLGHFTVHASITLVVFICRFVFCN
jgi:hypothetical protein